MASERGEFARYGYFPGHEISAEKPLLLLVAPALHVHPSTDTILRYLSRRLSGSCWGRRALAGGLKVVFRKRARDIRNPGADRRSA